MRKSIHILTLAGLMAAILLTPAISALGDVGPDALKACRDFAFSLEEDFVTQGPTPSDGNPIISDGDLLGRNCIVCARNGDLLGRFDVRADLGLDAVHIIDVENYRVAFSTSLDSPNLGQFTAGDLLITRVGIIPNIALLDKFGIRADLGLDAVQLIGNPDGIKRFLEFAGTVSREQWLQKPELLSEVLTEFEVDILFSTEGTGPRPDKPMFLDGDLLSARLGIIVESNGTLLPNSVPAGIPVRGVDFGLDAGTLALGEQGLTLLFSTEILYNGKPLFTDGDVLELNNGVVIDNSQLVTCFEPKADFLGLDAFFIAVDQPTMESFSLQLKEAAERYVPVAANASGSQNIMSPGANPSDSIELKLESCREIAFSTEEDFITQGPEPPDGNPIISDGDLLGKNCFVCARNRELLSVFDVGLDLGLDAVDVIDVKAGLAAFSTELDSPNQGQFTAGDLLATNGTIIPNLALMYLFDIRYDMGLDALFCVGPPERIIGFFDRTKDLPREFWLNNPDDLSEMLDQFGIDIWFSVEGTGPTPSTPGFLDGDLLSAAGGTIVASNDILLPPEVPAGIPLRGVDFGLDAVTGNREGHAEMINFSTEILYRNEFAFTDGDVLKLGNGVLFKNQELIRCFEPRADFLGLDALSRGCIPHLEWTWNSTSVEPDYVQVMMAPVVADLNADSIPDIIFSTFSAGAGWQAGGILRAISGDNSGELFSVTDPAFRVQAGAEPAVADIDNDGKPEILVSKDSGTGEIICFEHDGTFKWVSSNYAPGRIGIAVADLDQDGTPEIIAGKTALNNDGTVRWTGAAGSSYLSAVADLDLDGSPEVVTGGSAYHFDGSTYWSSAPAGRPAIANFDADPFPEIVVVGNDQVSLKEHDGTLKWGPVSMPPGGGNGPPVVADIDGDGQVEIGVGGYDYYVAFETDGTIKWMADIRDYSSRAAGSSAFDFDGDGSAEIVFSDERYHRIFRGSDGAVLFETPGRSGTLMEQPIIVDVDNDGHVEIVFAVNNYGAPAFNTGIEVYGIDACWPNARKIWNQHTYHITNINDNASVPPVESNNWLILNNYRTQVAPLCECDLNRDGRCDGRDWLLFYPDWGRTDCNDPGVDCECDLNGDGSCDGRDWLLFYPDWGRSDCPILP